VFKGGQDGANPEGSLVIDASSNLYGTTSGSGLACQYGCGTVFELSPTSTGWKETVLHNFNGDDGDTPLGGVVLDAAGNLYGTTEKGGGGCGCGTVFELSPGSKGWTEQVLYGFAGGSDGANPAAGVTMDASGDLYGTTFEGGSSSCTFYRGCGTVYELSPTSHGWTERVLYRFPSGPGGEAQTAGNVVFDASGNLYGTTWKGGKSACGTVFELTPSSGGKWTESTIYQFTCGGDGADPGAGVTLDAAGNIYGNAELGGVGDNGTIFKLTPLSGGDWTFSVLHAFTGHRDGSEPSAGMVLDATGTHLFGVTFTGGTDHAAAGSASCLKIHHRGSPAHA
jgi:uncharacterized repeat protein (TIGR03803 family)